MDIENEARWPSRRSLVGAPRVSFALCVLCLAGCAGGKKAPAWFGPTCARALDDGARQFCGAGTGATAAEAERNAQKAALAAAASRVAAAGGGGLTLRSACIRDGVGGEAHARCLADERARFRIDARTVQLRAGTWNQRQAGETATKGTFRAWVSLKIPRDEWQRLGRVAGGRALLALACHDDRGAECGDTALGLALDGAASCGVLSAGEPMISTDRAPVPALLAEARRRGAAWLVTTRLVSGPAGEAADGSVHMPGAGEWAVYDADNGQLLAARDLPGVDVTHLSGGEAARAALNDVAVQLGESRCDAPTAAGSYCCALLHGAPRPELPAVTPAR